MIEKTETIQKMIVDRGFESIVKNSGQNYECTIWEKKDPSKYFKTNRQTKDDALEDCWALFDGWYIPNRLLQVRPI